MLGDKFFVSTDGFHNKVMMRELFNFSRVTRSVGKMLELLHTELDVHLPGWRRRKSSAAVSANSRCSLFN
jgi:hypothetical protein